MSYDALTYAVQEHGGLSSRADAEAAVAAVFSAIARRVLPADHRAVVALLPDELAATFEKVQLADSETVEAVVAEIARAEGVQPGFGREHLDVVGAAIADTLHPDALTALRTHLPSPLAAVFEPRPVPEPRPPHVGEGEPRHLSAGRPGGTHPVSESVADRAQSESVARSDDPHADTKLSTTPGMTQEREHETLADND